jgi:hypothetical protein
MRGFLKWRFKAFDALQFEDDVTVYRDKVPQKGQEYIVRFKAKLWDKSTTQVHENDEDEDVTFILERMSDVFLVPADIDPTQEDVSSLEDSDDSGASLPSGDGHSA